MSTEDRARIHRALGDELRLRLVDELILGDMTPAELGDLTGLPSNLLAHHLGVLEESGLLLRRHGEGDRRKRYLSLDRDLLGGVIPTPPVIAGSVVFVCSHNSARSQFAEAALRSRSDIEVQSAGPLPADRVHPKAVSAAAEMGIALATGHPKPYDQVRGAPDLVISVCDRAREAPMPFRAARLHWSIPDPVEVDRVEAFRIAFGTISRRVDRLVAALEEGTTR